MIIIKKGKSIFENWNNRIEWKWSLFFKDTHRKKAPSNKTQVLTKITYMGIWVVGTTNELFLRGS